MNDKKYLRVVIVIILILAVVSVGLVWLLGNNTNDNIDNIDDTSSIDNPTLRVLQNAANEFFTVQRIVNNYYEIIKSNNAQEIYNVLDKDYVISNAIDENNVLNFFTNDYEDTSYIAKEIQYIRGENTTYYFVNGYLLNQNIVTEEIEYNANVNYLVITDTEKNLYAIHPLESNEFNNFVSSYDFKNTLELNEDNSYSNINIIETNKLTTYINEFLSLMFLDTERAYNMLDDATKSYFGSYDSFSDSLLDTYDRISPVIFSYSQETGDDYILYSVIDNNDNRIRIYEYNTMNYVLGFNFD